MMRKLISAGCVLLPALIELAATTMTNFRGLCRIIRRPGFGSILNPFSTRPAVFFSEESEVME